MSGLLIPNAKQQFLDANGNPLAGGKVYYYIPSTTTFKNTYQNAALTILNTNPIVLDTAGECIAYGAGSYRQLVTDVNGNLIWDQPTVSFLPVDSTNVIYTPPFTNSVAETVSAKLSEFVSVKDFGAVGDGTTDDTTAIQTAINYATSVKGKLYFPVGTYLHATTLIFKNNVIYYGEGQGSILKYTGTSDQIQVNNPINSSTAANIVVKDLYLISTNQTTGKANFADVGSTYLTFSNVAFSCNYYGLILGQSELVVVEKCNFSQNSASCQASVWIVNGPGHTVGANAFYTNRLTFVNNQFNGLGIYGIIDDGGTAHSFENNNFNAMQVQMRMTAMRNSIISGNEFEGATVHALGFYSSYYAGGGASVAFGSVTVNENFIVGGSSTNNAVFFSASTGLALIYTGNNFAIDSSFLPPDNNPLLYVNNVVAFGNTNTGTGSSPTNNVNVSGTWTPVIGGSTTLGTGTYTAQLGSYTKNANICTFQAQIVWSAHTGTGGQIYVSLPLDVLSTNIQFSPIAITSSGITLSAGSQIVALLNPANSSFSSAGTLQLYTSNAGVLSPLAITSSGSLYISGEYIVQ